MNEQNRTGFVFFRAPSFWLIILVTFALSVFCYWSDWATLFKLNQVDQEGSLIKNTGKALVAGVFLGVLFRNAVVAVTLGFIVPSLVVRQIGISRDAPPDTNLLPLVVGADILLSALVVAAILIASLAARWFVKRPRGDKAPRK